MTPTTPTTTTEKQVPREYTYYEKLMIWQLMGWLEQQAQTQAEAVPARKSSKKRKVVRTIPGSENIPAQE